MTASPMRRLMREMKRSVSPQPLYSREQINDSMRRFHEEEDAARTEIDKMQGLIGRCISIYRYRGYAGPGLSLLRRIHVWDFETVYDGTGITRRRRMWVNHRSNRKGRRTMSRLIRLMREENPRELLVILIEVHRYEDRIAKLRDRSAR